jgi:osmoprotectant transport system permease protein
MTDAVRTHAKVVAVSGSVLGVAAALVAHGLIFRPNRIMDTDPVSLVSALGVWGWVLVALWAAAGALALSPLPERTRGVLVTVLAGAAPALLIWRCGMAASAYAAQAGDVARTSLGAMVWVSLFAGYMVIFAATAWLAPGPLRAGLTYAPVLAIAALIATGSLAELAIAREYANNADSFAREFRLHLTYVAASVGIGLVAGLLLGLLAARGRSLEAGVFGVLNVLQVLPTLAFIGLMSPVLASLSDNIALFERWGVRGVGWAPVIIVLSAYAVYPIARNTHAAIVSLDPGVLDAAQGIGMGRLRRLAEIELPLAMPVIVAGLRIALVQTTAGAIVAGLVGGGGLGTFVFLGAGETATDLILLGVLPIMALALTFDRGVLALQRALGDRKAAT